MLWDKKTIITLQDWADIDNFVITYTETDGSETITLTANSGFAFVTGDQHHLPIFILEYDNILTINF